MKQPMRVQGKNVRTSWVVPPPYGWQPKNVQSPSGYVGQPMRVGQASTAEGVGIAALACIGSQMKQRVAGVGQVPIPAAALNC